MVLRPYNVFDKSSYLIMPSARNYFTSVQSEQTISLKDFWSFYINPSSPANVLKLKLRGSTRKKNSVFSNLKLNK